MITTERGILSSFLETLSSLSFDIFGLIAGYITSLTASLVVAMPWILIIYPPLLTVRGNISGIFSGRLTTGLHMGLVKPTIRKNSQYYYSLCYSVFFMSVTNSLVISFLAYAVYLALVPSHTLSFITITSMVFLSMLIPTTISVFFITPLVSIISYKKGMDPDVVVYPVMSTVNDIIVSSTYVILVFLLAFNSLIFMVISLVLGIAFSLIFLNSLRYVKDTTFKKTIIEGTPLVLLLAVLSNFTGGILSSFRYQIARYPHILVIYPSLIDTVGDEGSIIASVLTTKLNLGYVKPKIREILSKKNKDFILGTFAAGTVIFSIFTLIGSFFYMLSLLEIIKTVLVAISTNLFLLIPVLFIALFSSIITFTHGLNPDNFTIPIISSLSDLLTTIALFISLMIFY
ncbi:MAG: magnesium transporter [Candidatus Asgardarchaeia archaeon]